MSKKTRAPFQYRPDPIIAAVAAHVEARKALLAALNIPEVPRNMKRRDAAEAAAHEMLRASESRIAVIRPRSLRGLLVLLAHMDKIAAQEKSERWGVAVLEKQNARIIANIHTTLRKIVNS